MSKIVYIGVDGGGTKTSICASGNVDVDGIIKSRSGSINYNFIGIQKAAENLADGIKKLNLPKDVVIAGIAVGDPSVDDMAESPLTKEFVRNVRRMLDLDDSCQILVKSDVFMALYGMTEGEAGVLMISGTGSMGMAVDKIGKLYVSGGWGRLTEDEGSGYYIAVNGIKAALRYYDEIGPETVLLEEMKKYFGMEDPRKFILEYYADPEKYPDIAGFAECVGKAAKRDDEAVKIIKKSAEILAQNVISLIRKIRLYDCSVGIYGSVFLKNEEIRQKFEQIVKAKYPEVKIVIPDVEPEIAALKYIINCERS